MNDDETVIVVPSNDGEYHNAQQFISNLSEKDVLRYWSTFYFGNVSMAVLVFMRNGVIRKSMAISRRDIEDQYSLLISKGLDMLEQILQRIWTICRQLTEGKMYVISMEQAEADEMVLRLLKRPGDVCRRGNAANG